MADSTEIQLDERIQEILEKFPFLSYGRLQDTHYLGIVANSDNQMISMYVMDMIPEESARRLFLYFGDQWWWNSNRRVPISMFIKDPRFKAFRACLKHFSRKDFELISGPAVSLAESMARRVRRRQVTLVRRMPD